MLQEGTLRRIGATDETSIDIRYLCATNISPAKLLNLSVFRRDLLYRLSVIPTFVAPIRERREDIILLIDHFLAFYNTAIHYPLPVRSGLSPVRLRPCRAHLKNEADTPGCRVCFVFFQNEGIKATPLNGKRGVALAVVLVQIDLGMVFISQLKLGNHLSQKLCLAAHFFTGGRTFLGSGSICLYNLGYLCNALVYLRNA